MCGRYKIVGYFFLPFILVACASAPVAPEPTKQQAASSPEVVLGLAYLKNGETALAKEKLLKALQENPKDSTVNGAFGYFLEQTGASKMAESYYLSAIHFADKRTLGAARNNYGTYLYRQNHFESALDYFLASAKDPYYLEVASAYNNAGKAALKMQQKQDAAVYFAQAKRAAGSK